MTDWFTTHGGLLARAWQELSAGAGDAITPGHRVVLATLNASGPEARMVVLRGADPQAGTVDIHTDATSCKIGDLRADPRAALHFWCDAQQLQLRLRGNMTITTGPETTDAWASLRTTARFSYGVKPAPGTPIDTSDAYSRIPDPGQFAVLTLCVDDIDIVHLSDDYHRRARYLRAQAWRGTWIAP